VRDACAAGVAPAKADPTPHLERLRARVGRAISAHAELEWEDVGGKDHPSGGKWCTHVFAAKTDDGYVLTTYNNGRATGWSLWRGTSKLDRGSNVPVEADRRSAAIAAWVKHAEQPRGGRAK
jgi:hypothetical protein